MLKLSGKQLKILEVGCGVGNFMFPLLEEIFDVFFYACDFSPRAVQYVKVHGLICLLLVTIFFLFTFVFVFEDGKIASVTLYDELLVVFIDELVTRKALKTPESLHLLHGCSICQFITS